MKTIKTLTDGTILLTAPVMIPGAKDCDWINGEPPLTAEQIREFAKTYEKYQFIDHEHGLTKNGTRIGEPVDSFLLTEDTTMTLLDGSLKSYPRGSWFVTSHITDPEAVQLALGGGYTGYSASVFTKSRADEYLAALKSDNSTPLPCSCKDVSSSGNSLIKDVPDPVVLSVSLVKSPCLHDSLFCEVNKGEIMENQEDVKSLKSKVLSAMGMSEEAEVVALKSEVEDLKATITTMQTDFQTALKSMQDEFTKTLTEALHPVESEALKAKEDDDEDEETKVKEEETEEESADEVAEEEETEEEETEEPVSEKGESKAEPVHDNLSAEKSKPVNIYEIMGKNPDGTRKK